MILFIVQYTHFLYTCYFALVQNMSLLAGWCEGHATCKKTERWYYGSSDLTEAVFIFQLAPLLPPVISCCCKIQVFL